MKDIDEPLQEVEKESRKFMFPMSEAVHKKKGLSWEECASILEKFKDFICCCRGLRYYGEERRGGVFKRSVPQLNFMWGVVCRFIYDNDRSGRFEGREYDFLLKEEIMTSLKYECNFYDKKKFSTFDGDIKDYIVPKSLSFSKTNRKEIKAFIDRVDVFLLRNFGIGTEGILAKKDEEKKPSSHAVQNEDGDGTADARAIAIEKNRGDLYREQGGLCWGCLLHRDAFVLSTSIPTDIHHMVKQSKVNLKKLGNEFVHGLKNLVLLCRQCHKDYEDYNEKDKRKIKWRRMFFE